MKQSSNLGGFLLACAILGGGMLLYSHPVHWPHVGPSATTEFAMGAKGLQTDLSTGLSELARQVDGGQITTGAALVDTWKKTREAAHQRNLGWVEKDLQAHTGSKFDKAKVSAALKAEAAKVAR